MQIKNMFSKSIDRKINGVIQVEQDTLNVIEQEVSEYVITRELKRHFISFFNAYADSFVHPTSDVGVWISGFFGSGKSHFLKMLSYILENRDVKGIRTVERFREKFAEDPASFMPVDRSTQGPTETILFNIDIEGSINKDKTAVLRVFAKMFYNHLGFFGDELKVAMLEKYIDECGKTEEFRRIFEEKKGKPWLTQRKAFAFNRKVIVPTLMEVLDLSESDAQAWFDDKSSVEFSIARLVADINEYISRKPRDFRLVFLIDEVGQYVGTDTDMLLNLQSLVEKLGSECGGKVWIICTGQEAIDEIIKVRTDEFSRIQARFKTRLSLTSSSVDEVVQKRILDKTPEAQVRLESIFHENDSVLRNLFSFEAAMKDIRGFNGPREFVQDFPFVPYQFILMQKVFNEIRKHGNSGKHQSNGERSMLSGFQEAAQKVKECDEYTLVPFSRFYDTVHSFLDSSIRRVIDRCQRAADEGLGLEQYDVSILKLLYLIRYVDDVKATVDNIVILMADDIRVDKITLRESVRASLDRLLSQNYIGRTGEIYNFLTDEEQDIHREISLTVVDTSAIVARIAQLIGGDIYSAKKFRYGIHDFSFDQFVDGVAAGTVTGGMKLIFLTEATDAADKSELQLMAKSVGQAMVVLGETRYYESLERAMKIRKYVKQRNIAQLPKSVQDIIQKQQAEATRCEQASMDALRRAIEGARFYVDGEHLPIKSGDAKSRIDQAMEYLVAHVYSEIDLIAKYADTDEDIIGILTQASIAGTSPNQDACAKVEEYLEMQFKKNLPTSMADIQSRYQAMPYGWREIDVAAVVAQLIHDQKVTVKYMGNTIQPLDSRLPNLLRKKSEIGKAIVSKRQRPNEVDIKKARKFLRDYFDVMDVPEDEDGLIAFILDRFGAQKAHFEELLRRYVSGKNYPDRDLVEDAAALMDKVLSQKKDNIALIKAVNRYQQDLRDSKAEMQDVEGFFRNQVQIFDAAAKLEADLFNEREYLTREPEADAALNKIRLITSVKGGFSYRKIPELNGLMATVRAGHDRLLDAKREEINEYVTQCLGAVHQAGGGRPDTRDVCEKADTYFDQKRQQIRSLTSLALLDGLVPQMMNQKDTYCKTIAAIIAPHEPPKHPGPYKKVIKSYQRGILFPAQTLESEAAIDAYVEQMRVNMKQLLSGCDGIELK